MLSKPKDQKLAAVLAISGILIPGLHKFYLGQPMWGIFYVLLSWTPVPKFASVIEGIWYLLQSSDEFKRNFNASAPLSAASVSPVEAVDPARVGAVADALRQLDTLRQDGLISEFEFEQKRRQLLDRIV
ncbi:NINE protein [Oculatella sp. LEGE 06141]|uniref:NINE protein n=1 Tax=Oculatella sp. LEGE 06141 TaxID=1828648 RepID=UPI00187E823C|nr:NINE protein [Oculatella sp. LEGE 06141]MBE9177979.1 NINE protein [Oculatella sp. LEGE 06141]